MDYVHTNEHGHRFEAARGGPGANKVNKKCLSVEFYSGSAAPDGFTALREGHT